MFVMYVHYSNKMKKTMECSTKKNTTFKQIRGVCVCYKQPKKKREWCYILKHCKDVMCVCES